MKSALHAIAFVIAVTAFGGMSGCPGTTMTTGTSASLGSPGSMSAAETQLAMNALTAINAHRAGKGLPALSWHAGVAQVAFEHSVAMQNGGFFAHINPTTNSSPASRAQAAGITHDPLGSIDPSTGLPFVGENLFMTTDPAVTGQAAVDAWVASPGHHTQIDAPLPVAGTTIMPPWTHCGIGVRRSGGTTWCTAVFLRNPN